MSSAIHLHDLRFHWPGQKHPTLNIADWRVAAGEHLFLYGPSGSGKSTLLNLLAGILVPQQGSVTVLQTDLAQLGGRARDRFRARHIGLVFQQFNLLPYLDVETNVRLAAEFNRQPPDSRQRARTLLERLQLPASLYTRKASELSVGQQQRVAVARALINQPPLIIADEPTSALDSDSRDAFIHLLLDCAAQQASTVIFVSHDRTLAPYFSRQQDLHLLHSPDPETTCHVA